MAYHPIAEYGIIGNQISATLVSRGGACDWSCLPRFDSPSVFGAILDSQRGGSFEIRPVAAFAPEQEYLGETNILVTRFQTDTGQVLVTDFMPCYVTEGGHQHAVSEIIRIVECSAGAVEMVATFWPRLEYGRGATVLSVVRHGVIARQGEVTLTLSTTVSFTVAREKSHGRFTLRAGGKEIFVVRVNERPVHPARLMPHMKLARTALFWEKKASECRYSGPWREMVVRSYLALHLLIYAPSGAIVAAPTTSLPEQIGGSRNWDYRYSWIRDSSLTLFAFAQLGHQDDIDRFMKWFGAMCHKCGARAQILYGIDLHLPPEEQVLFHLEGYKKSAPVRIGNGAWQQRQLDVFGELVATGYEFLRLQGQLQPRTWDLLKSFVEAACQLWPEADSGIWEMRSVPRHFLHSKLMCWVAVDRGIRIAELLGESDRIYRWRENAEMLRRDILRNGWCESSRSFRQHYDTDGLDASTLAVLLYGLLPPDDPRVVDNLKNTVAGLNVGGLIRRYDTETTDDGVRGTEGVFLMCNFWVVRSLWRIGEAEQAVRLFERLLGYANHVGLFSEMAVPSTKEALGNFPQALTHLEVIVSALELNQVLGERC
jgi:GH15 family glucan-1,4-alpha-glucosidase